MCCVANFQFCFNIIYLFNILLLQTETCTLFTHQQICFLKISSCIVNFLDILRNQFLKLNFIFGLSACFKFSSVMFLSFHGILGVNILNSMLRSSLILKFWVNLCLGSYSSTQWFSTRVHAGILYKCFEDGFC